MIEEKSEGILLESRPYQDNHRICSLFTPHRGIIRLFVKSSLIKHSHGLVTPITRIEALYHAKNDNNLFRVDELSLIDPYTELRRSYPALQAASFLLHSLLRSQMGHEEAPELYKLLLCYLAEIGKHEPSNALRASFILKLLRHDGLLGIRARCDRCGVALTTAALASGETLCKSHAPSWAYSFDDKELTALSQLATSRKLEEIQKINITEKLVEKIQRVFEQLTEQV